MNLERYDTLVTDDVLTFSFTSVGPKGYIQKLVIYQHVEGPLYNLAFGDRNGALGTIDDLIITDNKDTEKVLATVASTIFDFFATYSGTVVLAQGSTHSRTRLYRRYLTMFFDFIDQEFILYGELDGEIERFIKGKDYRAFFIAKK
ncbi:MAG: hypothetical protein IPK35_24210 [Saprospiraceae bacterium]|jgi:hypothetical protein|nr:hypothetical protein [Saprospiraceae bacterium]